MKKTRISILLILVTIASFISVIAESGINIYVDGTELKSNKPAFINNGSTMVPMRDIFELLNAEVKWNGNTKTITASKQDTTINLQIDSDTLVKNGVSEQLDAVPVIVDDTTFVPVRAVSQALGANVSWDGDTQTVYITSGERAPIDNTVPTNAEPTVTMYAADGRTISVPQSEVEAYKNVNWYTEPVVLMYAADGRTLYVVESEVEAYKAVNWYTEPYTPPKSSYGSGKSSSSGSSTQVGSTVYVTPSGKRYHYRASCAGKNARATTLSSAKASGYTPCKKCAR